LRVLTVAVTSRHGWLGTAESGFNSLHGVRKGNGLLLFMSGFRAGRSFVNGKHRGGFDREATSYRIGMGDNADHKTRKGFPMTHRFAVRGDHIQLDQLLKATGLADSGGAAHAAIGNGLVSVDGKIETRKRAKLRPGQQVAFAGEVVDLVRD